MKTWEQRHSLPTKAERPCRWMMRPRQPFYAPQHSVRCCCWRGWPAHISADDDVVAAVVAAALDAIVVVDIESD